MIKAKSKRTYSLIHFNEIDQFCVVVFESVILGSMNMFLSSKKGFLVPSWVTWQKEQMAPALSGIKDSWGLWSTIGLPAHVLSSERSPTVVGACHGAFEHDRQYTAHVYLPTC